MRSINRRPVPSLPYGHVGHVPRALNQMGAPNNRNYNFRPIKKAP